jgi:hypothetical protein
MSKSFGIIVDTDLTETLEDICPDCKQFFCECQLEKIYNRSINKWDFVNQCLEVTNISKDDLFKWHDNHVEQLAKENINRIHEFAKENGLI